MNKPFIEAGVPDWMSNQCMIEKNISIIREFFNELITSELLCRVEHEMLNFIKKVKDDNLEGILTQKILPPKFWILKQAIEDVLFAYSCLSEIIETNLEKPQRRLPTVASSYASYLKEDTTSDKVLLQDIINEKFNKIIFENKY